MFKPLKNLIQAALGNEPADLLFKNATLFNPFDCEWEESSVAVKDGYVVGIGEYRGLKEIDLRGSKVIPGLIDSHVHIESSLLTPVEYGRLVLKHGTTTVVADPHEIANVAGLCGLEYMLKEREESLLDILYMVPSCVPASAMDMGGAILEAEDLKLFVEMEGVPGLAEMMNVPGVLAGDPGVWDKLELFDIIDGHAPLLRGKELNAYILAGIQSDHECAELDEAREKLRRGMYIMMREGSTERNLKALIPLVNAYTVSRCSFATDDRHADMLLYEGHIDDCIRKAISYGLEPELAYRMATLSAAERFLLQDRGAVAPGKLADFCVIDDSNGFEVKKTFKRGVEYIDPGYLPRPPLERQFCSAPITSNSLKIKGKGRARVIGLVQDQILTENQIIELDSGEIPDIKRDILKLVVCDRYRGTGCGLGLVHGFGLKRGAIACSVSHDSHNIVAVGVTDKEIIHAVSEVVNNNGGMVTVLDDDVTILPLECAGLMSILPCEEVVSGFEKLKMKVTEMGGTGDPFMYLSFLALTVIPNLRLTERGVFDVVQFRDVPLFLEYTDCARTPHP
ncbi:MAG: adenine deaminase [Methanogenium sp.]|nr:adenine deaminase [Methanogenium sp.]